VYRRLKHIERKALSMPWTESCVDIAGRLYYRARQSMRLLIDVLQFLDEGRL
jgi:hypothetical protein